VTRCSAHRQGVAIVLPRIGIALDLEQLRSPRMMRRSKLTVDEAVVDHVHDVCHMLWPTLEEPRIHVDHWHVSPLAALGSHTVENGLLLVEVCVTLLPPTGADSERH
jgi:hypothetical protein